MKIEKASILGIALYKIKYNFINKKYKESLQLITVFDKKQANVNVFHSKV